ncbi:hypothetical protein BIZ78_gp025 [Erwinia phage vB_EamM_Caitlin]|uniref:hypothetical protein n=1 Tax=Erwinia phage vB_EamM_Caitlin TaxID=1883379 RepID=UPI00081D0CDB|nr:hypothetical protein BIZ78_gp025 [Erwinia phage vB_EamM_Caitlin]ANZ48550.1 hypothetical protein CAITLIN_255 [Erwinia phage vB_EamM_Caitlin]
MIRLYSLNACTNALRILKQTNLRLSADVDSPIAVLNKATSQQSVLDSSITDEQFFQELPNITALAQPAQGTGEAAIIGDGAAGVNVLNVEDHEPTLFELKKMAVSRCAGLLDFSRNVVQPFVQSVIQNNDAAPVEEVKEDWALVPVDTDPSLNEPVVQALINRLDNPAGAGYMHDRIDARVPDVLDQPETGKASFDRLVGKLLTELGWSVSDAAKAMIEPLVVVPNSDQAPKEVKKNVLFMLLTAYWLDNPWANSDLSSDKWRTQFQRAHYALCGWLYLYADAIVTRVKLGNIVFSFDSQDKQVYICQEAFEDYVGAGGTVEALLGAVYTLDDGEDASTTKAALLDNQQAFTQAWTRRSSIRRMTSDNDWLHRNRESLKVAFATAIDVLDPGYLNAGDEAQRTPAEVKAAVNTSIDHLFGKHTVDVTEFIIQVSSGEVFGEYDAANLLMAIHHGMLKGVKPEDTANDWIINYVLDWMLQGVLIEA